MPVSSRFRRLSRVGAIPLLFLTALALLVGGLSAPAYAAAGTISGVVTRAGTLQSTPLAGVTVSLCDGNGASCGGAGRTTTSSESGAYTLTVPAGTGTYNVHFSRAGHDSEFYDNAATAAAARDLSVGDDVNEPGVNGSLASSTVSQIGGKVTTSSGAPISGADITLFTRNPADAGTGQISYTERASQSTGADGSWVLDQAHGKYVVEVSAPAYGTYYFQGNNSLTANRDSAPEIEVRKGEATLLNASLTARTTTTISGRVTTGGTPIQGVEVSVEYSSLNAQGQTTWTEVQSTKARTAANGTYAATVPPVTDGRQYVVGFKAPGFRSEFYDDATTRDEPAVQTVSPTVGSPETDIDADLARATQVTGRVTDQAGAGLAGVEVNAVTYQANGAQRGAWDTVIADTDTLGDGTYVLDVPPDTKFRLEFKPTDQRPTRYFPSANFPDEGATLSVPSSTVLTSRNMTLPTASTVRGTVTETSGAAYTGTGTVSAWEQVAWSELGERGGVAHTSWFQIPGSTATVSNGAFTMRVPQGSYRLKFVDAATTEEGFLPGLVGLDQAPDVTVGAQQDLAAQTYQLPPVQTVRGIVRDLAGTPVAGAFVGAEYAYVEDVRDGVVHTSRVIGPNASPARRSATTQTGGSYTLQLRSRTYQVFAKASSAAAEKSYFGDLQEDGTRVPRDVVVSSADVADVDITLVGEGLQNTRAPWISGLNDEGSTLTANPGSWSPELGLSFQYVWSYKPPSSTTPPAADDQEPVGAPAPVCPQAQPAATCWTELTRSSSNAGNGVGNPSLDGRTLAIPNDGLFCVRDPFGDPLPSSDGCYQDVRYRVKVVPVVNGEPKAGDARFGQYRTQTLDDTTPTDEPRAAPRILGKAVVGETLSTDSGVWAQQSTYTYQWFRGPAKIDGATASTYQPVPGDVGSILTVQVLPTAHPNLQPAQSAPTARVGNGTISNTTLPSISGTARVGETLTADPGTWSPTPSSFSYAWLANGQPISGATSRTYRPVEADVRKVLTVQVTALLTGYTPATRTSAGTAPVSLDGTDPTKLVNKTEPSITGTAQVGKTLTAENGEWTNSPSFTYQWLADEADITGATSKTFELTAGEVGKVVSVEVTARRDGFDPVTIETDPTNPVARGVFTNEAKPTISGTVRPGSTVTALPGSWTPSTGVTYGYQWLLDNAAVPGATSSTYAVKESDLDKLLSVRVTATKPGYNELTAVSEGTLVTPDGDNSLEVTTPSVINGKPEVGETLRLVVGATSPAYETAAIQWLRNGTPVAGRTGTSYQITRADLGAPISARVTYKKSGYTDEVETRTTPAVTEPEEPTEPAKPTLQVTKKLTGSKLVVKVRVLASSQSPVTGQVELTEGQKLYALKTLDNGKKKLVVKRLKKGFHSVKLTFLGNDLVKRRSKTLNFTVSGRR